MYEKCIIRIPPGQTHEWTDEERFRFETTDIYDENGTTVVVLEHFDSPAPSPEEIAVRETGNAAFVVALNNRKTWNEAMNARDTAQKPLLAEIQRRRQEREAGFRRQAEKAKQQVLNEGGNLTEALNAKENTFSRLLREASDLESGRTAARAGAV